MAIASSAQPHGALTEGAPGGYQSSRVGDGGSLPPCVASGDEAVKRARQDDVLGLRPAARLLGTSPRHLQCMAKSGAIPAVGRRPGYSFLRSEIEQHSRRQRRSRATLPRSDKAVPTWWPRMQSAWLRNPRKGLAFLVSQGVSPGHAQAMIRRWQCGGRAEGDLEYQLRMIDRQHVEAHARHSTRNAQARQGRAVRCTRPRRPRARARRSGSSARAPTGDDGAGGDDGPGSPGPGDWPGLALVDSVPCRAGVPQ